MCILDLKKFRGDKVNPAAATSPQTHSERRQFGRRGTCKSAKIIPETGDFLNGTVVNQSDHGAGILLTNAAPMPEQFELLIEVDDTITLCRLTWQNGENVGATFLRSPRRASNADRASAKARRLQLERWLVNHMGHQRK